MRFRSVKRGKDTYLALFDIGATSVGVAVAHSNNGTTTLLWSSRTEYSYQAYDEYTRYERAMYSTLLEAGMKLTSEGISSVRAVRPDFKAEHMQVVCVLASPWFWGTVGKAQVVQEKTFEVTEELIEDLSRQAQKSAFETPETQSWHDVVGKSDLLENVRQILKINGYRTNVQKYQNASSMSVEIYFAFVASTVLKQVREIVERVLPNHQVELTTSTKLLAQLYRATVGSGTGNRAFLIEIEGRITSVASIHQGVLSRVSTLPLGTNHILRAAAPNAISTKEARGKLSMIMKAKEKDSAFKLPDDIEAACNEWRDLVRDEIKKHCDGIIPSENVFLLVGKRWHDILIPKLKQPWIMPGIRKERSLTLTPFTVFTESHKAKEGPQDREHDSVFDSRLQLFTHAVFYCA